MSVYELFFNALLTEILIISGLILTGTVLSLFILLAVMIYQDEEW